MKQLMLAAVASIALSLPAMAQSNNTNGIQPNNLSQTGSQSKADNQTINGSGRQAQNRVDPSRLSKSQIRQIQMTLNKKGFDAKQVDGIWGPETDAALKNFQQQQNLPGNGQLNRRTLSALGVTMKGQNQQGSATTGSGSNESRMNQPAQNTGRLQNDNANVSGQGSNNSANQPSPQKDNQTNGNGTDNGSSPGNNRQ